jgi:hypothetical protein
MVDIDDAVWLVELLVELALHPAGVAGTSKVAIKKTERAMDARYREQARRLRRQPLQLSPSLEIADGDSGSE